MKRQITDMDFAQFMKRVYDQDSESLRMLLLPVEMGIEVREEDGDSVQTVKKTVATGQVNVNEEIDMSKAECFTLYGTATVQVSPVDSGDVWFDLEHSYMTTHHVHAMRLKVTSGSVYIVAKG